MGIIINKINLAAISENACGKALSRVFNTKNRENSLFYFFTISVADLPMFHFI